MVLGTGIRFHVFTAFRVHTGTLWYISHALTFQIRAPFVYFAVAASLPEFFLILPEIFYPRRGPALPLPGGLKMQDTGVHFVYGWYSALQ